MEYLWIVPWKQGWLEPWRRHTGRSWSRCTACLLASAAGARLCAAAGSGGGAALLSSRKLCLSPSLTSLCSSCRFSRRRRSWKPQRSWSREQSGEREWELPRRKRRSARGHPCSGTLRLTQPLSNNKWPPEDMLPLCFRACVVCATVSTQKSAKGVLSILEV